MFNQLILELSQWDLTSSEIQEIHLLVQTTIPQSTISETNRLVLRDTILPLLTQTTLQRKLFIQGSLWQVQITFFRVWRMQITCMQGSRTEEAISKNSFADILLGEDAILEITASSYMVREIKGNHELNFFW